MKPLSCFLLLLLFPLFAVAEPFSRPRLSGSLKSLILYSERIPHASEEGLFASQRLRLDFTARLIERFDLDISLEQQLLWSAPASRVSLPQDSLNRVVDWEYSWNRGGRFETQLQLDRLSLKGGFVDSQWTVGRQAIGLGQISLFSPLDVVAPFAPDAIDVDVRPGVDALKMVRYFGLAGQVGGVLVLGDEAKYNSYLLTLGENLGNLDLLVLFGSLRERPMFGVGLAGELGELGVKGELSWYRGREVGRVAGDLRDDFVIAALETWYRFDNGLVLLAEYLYNGAGSNVPAQYPQVATSAPLLEGLSFLLGRHYLLLGPSYAAHPLLTFSGLLIHNLQDRSSLLRPQLVVSLGDNLQLDLFWVFAFGKKPQPDPLFGLPVTRSEFGSIGDSGGLLIRWYF